MHVTQSNPPPRTAVRRRVTACWFPALAGLSMSLASAQTTVTPTEPNDSFATATPTGLTAATPGLVMAVGNSGDGPYAPVPVGNGTGDYDFYKLSAAAGQVITVQVRVDDANDNFDSIAVIYRYNGTTWSQEAFSDDDGTNPIGYERGSQLTYTVPATGDYYVAVANLQGADYAAAVPTNPTIPGTGQGGDQAGTVGQYRMYLGLNASLPATQFASSAGGVPVKKVFFQKKPNTTQYKATVQVINRGTANLVITGSTITGTGAAKFSASLPSLPLTIPAGGSAPVTVNFNSGGSTAMAQAELDFTSNDPYDQKITLQASGSPVVGGGFFQVRQVRSSTDINTLADADALLGGANVVGETKAALRVINFSTPVGSVGVFADDTHFPYPQSADRFALEVTGSIQVSTPGIYTLLVNSDDGQRLIVDGTTVITNDGAQGATSKFAPVNLTAGSHTIRYVMFDVSGGDAAEIGISHEPGTFTAVGQTTWEVLEARAGADTDGDGLPDDYEDGFGLLKASNADRNLDGDTDGLTNYQEFQLGTFPNLADTDGDTLTDGAEVTAGTNPLDPMDPIALPVVAGGLTYYVVDGGRNGTATSAYQDAGMDGADFDATDSWNGDRRYGNSPTTKADYTFANLAAGTYEVLVSWRNNPQANNAVDSVYTANGGIGTIPLDQRAGAAAVAAIRGGVVLTDPGARTVNFVHLGNAVLSTAGNLTVSVSDGGGTDINTFTFSDAVAIRFIPPANTEFTDWVALYPGVGALTGFTDDADGDGLKNGVEYILGSDPSSAGLGIWQVARTGTTMTFRHSRTNRPMTQVTSSYEWSTNLQNWFPSGQASNGTTVTLQSSVVTDNTEPANDEIEVTATVTGTPVTKLFLRLKASN